MEDGLLRRRSDHAVDSLRAALTRLRTRGGLTVERLRATELNLGPLTDLDLVRQLERAHRLPPEEAIVAAVRGGAAQLDGDDMLIVDAALALGLVAESFPEGPDVSGLYALDLSDRRTALVTSWPSLQELLGVKHPTRAPTVRALRTELESLAFERLAERILALSPLDTAPVGQPALTTPRAATGQTASDRPRAANGVSSRVVVVGAAVMDHIHVANHVPEAGRSIQATSYQLVPGGKGLNQAVGAARLGLETDLVATLGDDDAGRRVLAFLEDEGVGTDMIRLVPGATTPIATVIVTPDGTASTIGWMNQEQISVTVRDVRSRSVQAALDEAGTVMLTFELPRDTIEAVLETTAASPHRPATVLTPSPPHEGPRYAHESLGHVDYLVGTHWELSGLLPTASPDTPRDQLLTQLLVLGARTICLAESFGCVVQSNLAMFEVPPLPAAFTEAPGARDAFAAALALRLQESEGGLDEADAAWATAAMAFPQTFGGVAKSMPTREDVDRILRLASSQTGDNGV